LAASVALAAMWNRAERRLAWWLRLFGILFAIGLTVLTALVSGVIPALRASRPEVGVTLKAASPTGTGTRGRLRQILVVAQVGLSVVLLVCASLFVRSLSQAGSLDPGFSARQGLLASVDLVPGGYDQTRGPLFIEQLLERVSAVPHVTVASVAKTVPLDLGGSSEMGLTVEGYPAAAAGEEIVPGYNTVGPNYFEAMGITIVRGRGIGPKDVVGQPRVIVVNETMARRYWAGRDPIGGTVRFDGDSATVVGVARDGKYQRLSESADRFFTVPAYQTLPAAYAVTGVDTAQPGFNVTWHQTATLGQPNNVARAEQQLRGLRGANLIATATEAVPDVIARQRLLRGPVVVVLVAGRRAQFLCRRYVVDKFGECVVRQQIQPVRKALLVFQVHTVIRRVAPHRRHRRYVPELRKRPPHLRIARTHQLRTHLVDVHIRAAQFVTDRSEVAEFDERIAPDVLLHRKIPLHCISQLPLRLYKVECE
jgi:hypothetical protein